MFVQKLAIAITIYTDGNVAIIEGSDPQIVEYAANTINRNYFIPPLNVTIFWGYNRRRLANRWCIGFNTPKSERIVATLNSFSQIVCTDSHPENWYDCQNNTYSIVIPTKYLDFEIDNDNIPKIFETYLHCIERATQRKYKLSIIKPKIRKES